MRYLCPKIPTMLFSLIIPVFNRPEEIDELLLSLTRSKFKKPFEVIIIEDGSGKPCREVVERYFALLDISYYFKENSGPGDSRNFGMRKAKGDYFLIFDSDCIVPEQYLLEVEAALENKHVDCFGGPDAALDSFSDIQKAINFTMTSFLTTGGIRGGSEDMGKFQPRSFNMGLSRKAFEASGGFGSIHPGEDPDLSIRLWKLGFETALFRNAFVWHKRRIDWKKFTIQVNKFGKARPILDFWHPGYGKLTYWLPTIFLLMFIISLPSLAGFPYMFACFVVYFLVIFIVSSIKNKSLRIGLYSVIATGKQFFGYGSGFLESFIKIRLLRQTPEKAFPELFFK